MTYTATKQFKDNVTPKIYLAPLDIVRILSVYTDYEGNAIMIEDLFDTIIKEWTN